MSGEIMIVLLFLVADDGLAGIALPGFGGYIVITGGILMKARIVSIGNSKGIRIPKPLLEAAGLHNEVDLTAKRGLLLIRPARSPREGWAEAFREMTKRGDDSLFDDIPPVLSEWDAEEWEWQ
jgi:antitoxin MazE